MVLNYRMMKTKAEQQNNRCMEREVWVDWLRVLACLLVMVVHSSEPFYLDGYDTLIPTDADLIWASAIDSASRMSVPLFVIASSYLLFPLRYSSGEFFKRRTVRILIPFVIQVIVSILTAALTALGTTSCMGHGPLAI
jgi:Uncharacterized protein conserved in bacteria